MGNSAEHLVLEKLIDASNDSDPFLLAMDRVCEKKGHTEKVDHEVFQAFPQSTDKEMSGMMCFIIIARRNVVNRMMDDNAPDEDFITLVTNMLLLVARGRLWFGDEFELVYAKPIGPSPTPEEWDAIHQRIDNTRHMIGEAYLACGQASSENSQKTV
ncbi:hypothetical protein [Pontiella sulfatireligans]|nr:hypothetical protein [Pontiella sulfatireligans]